MQDILNLTRSTFEAFNQRDFDKIASLTSDQMNWIDLPTGVQFSGQQGVKQWCQLWANAFSDAKVEIVNHFGSGDFVCTEYIGRGRHTGPLLFGKIQVPPTQRSIEFRLCNVLQVRDGKLFSGRVYYDVLSVMRQLGLDQGQRAA